MKSMQEKESIMVLWCKLKIHGYSGNCSASRGFVTEFSISTSQPLKILIRDFIFRIIELILMSSQMFGFCDIALVLR